VSAPLSRKQLSHLGDRLAADGVLEPADAASLERVVQYYDEIRSRAQDRVAEVSHREFAGHNVRVTGRTKTTLTLRDKLRRTPAVKLPYIRDIAGIRVVAEMRLGDQDRLVEELCARFGCESSAKRVDRRAEPVAGYRALHVVLIIDGTPVEVQIRTELQALWADLYERQADLWGRQVRYGGEPTPDPSGSNARRRELLDDLIELSVDSIATFERALDDERPLDEAQLAEGEARARRLLRSRTTEALRQATEIRARDAKLRRTHNQIDQILARWSEIVRQRLNSLADRADTIA
jgi:hypothetical protein